jgi:hypothetical protein
MVYAITLTSTIFIYRYRSCARKGKGPPATVPQETPYNPGDRTNPATRTRNPEPEPGHEPGHEPGQMYGRDFSVDNVTINLHAQQPEGEKP